MIYIKITILLISSLTIMAGASIAPVLGMIKLHFSNESEFFIKLIIAIPAIFIILISSIFPKIAKKFNIKQIAIFGISLYLIGGVAAGFMPNFTMLLAMRAILGVGTGLLMPLSIGLVFLLLDKKEYLNFMGLQGFFNHLGGVIAMGLSGILGSIDYRYGFLVYLLALIAGIFVIAFLPKKKFYQQNSISFECVKKLSILLLCAFLSMAIYFILPSDFSLIATNKHFIDEKYIGLLLAFASVGGMLSGLLFRKMQVKFKGFLAFLTTMFYMIAFWLLSDFENIYSVGIGIFIVGFSLGIFMPLIVFKIGQKVENYELSFAMGIVSSFIFLGQFCSPFLVNFVKFSLKLNRENSGFLVAILLSFILFLLFFKESRSI